MELFDTHAHFDGADDAVAAALARARAAGVTRVVAVGGSAALNAGACRACRAAGPQGPAVARALGWDRDQAGLDLPSVDYAGAAAVGEIGLDYFRAPPETRPAQRALMAQQLELARARGLPVVVHTREADADTLALLGEAPVRGVVHCFTGSRPFCSRLLDLGLYVSISGIVTFRSAGEVREVARYIPDARLLVETDSPFLAPEPVRGRPNEPANLVHTVRFLAGLRGTDPEALAALTTANARALFGL